MAVDEAASALKSLWNVRLCTSVEGGGAESGISTPDFDLRRRGMARVDCQLSSISAWPRRLTLHWGLTSPGAIEDALRGIQGRQTDESVCKCVSYAYIKKQAAPVNDPR